MKVANTSTWSMLTPLYKLALKYFPTPKGVRVLKPTMPRSQAWIKKFRVLASSPPATSKGMFMRLRMTGFAMGVIIPKRRERV
jgi:hypothetical protein